MGILRRSVVLFLVAFVLPSVSYSEYYRWTDSDGVTHYSEEAPNRNALPLHFDEVPVTRFHPQNRTPISSSQIRQSVQSPQQVEVQRSSYEVQRQRERDNYDRKLLVDKCNGYRDDISNIDSRLRAGGYSSKQGNYLRRERRELSRFLTWECLRD